MDFRSDQDMDKLGFGALALTAPLALPMGELSAEQAD